jgi:hypothetical protein
MRHAVLAAALCLMGQAAAGPASAEDYWAVADNPSSFAFVDASTISDRGGGVTSAWVFVVDEGAEIAKDGYKENRTLAYFSCSGKQYAVKALVTYNEEGDNVQTVNNDEIQWKDIPPGTFGSAELSFVCSEPSLWPSNKTFVHLVAGFTPVESADALYKYLHPAGAAPRPRLKPHSE